MTKLRAFLCFLAIFCVFGRKKINLISIIGGGEGVGPKMDVFHHFLFEGFPYGLVGGEVEPVSGVSFG